MAFIFVDRPTNQTFVAKSQEELDYLADQAALADDFIEGAIDGMAEQNIDMHILSSRLITFGVIGLHRIFSEKTKKKMTPRKIKQQIMGDVEQIYETYLAQGEMEQARILH